MVVQAKVILKGAKTYTLAGSRFIQDVPRIIKGESKVAEFQANGFFNVTVLKAKAAKETDEALKSSKNAKSSSDDEDEDDEDEVAPSKKKTVLKKK